MTPVVAERTYSSGVTLKDSDLMGGTAIASGTWSWEDQTIVPTVKNSGYTAVFTPSDTTNYKTVKKVIPVTVKKATPYIQTIPTASAITYGDALNTAQITGGKAQYSSTDATEVTGSFAWPESAAGIKPTVSDSNSTSYKVIFTPGDTTNYNTTEAQIKLQVNKAPAAPNMTGSTRNVSNSTTTVGAVELPDGWTWIDADKEKALSVNVPLAATAEYQGVDKDNYDQITVAITITRSTCDHVHTELRNVKEATCIETGYTGDTWCLDCSTMLQSGTEIPEDENNHHYIGEQTKAPTRTEEGVMTYTCEWCGHTYTGAIAKLTDNSGSKSGGSKSGSSGKGSTSQADNSRQAAAQPQPVTEQPVQPVVTQPEPVVPQPDNNRQAAAQPEAGMPFIEGNADQKGWQAISAQAAETEAGNTITVDMNGSSVVPGSVFDAMRGKDVTVAFDMGNGMIWSVNGKSITADQVKDIDFTVTRNTKAIPVEILNNVTGERYSAQMSLAYEGEFGFTAVLSLNLEAENAGLFANLFYYNVAAGEMEFICADEIAADGTAELTFTHASDYAIVIDTEPMDDSMAVADSKADSPQAGADGAQTAAEETNAWNPWWVIGIGAVVIIIGLCAFYVIQKKKSEEE